MVAVSEALERYLRAQHIRDDCASPLEAYDERWFRVRVGASERAVFPMWGLRRVLVVHDVHHLLTGYGTHFAGELDLAAWELGAGGCGLNVAFWADRLLGMTLGLLTRPRSTLAAFRRGRRCRNLYGAATTTLLREDIDSVRERLGLAATR
jgi:hypothetical protein